MRKHVLVLVWLLLGCGALGQQTTVNGIVFDGESVVPLPFVKVFYKGTQVGCASDTTGHFSLSISDKLLVWDTIVVSYLGYISQEVAIQRGQNQDITIRLQSTLFIEYDEVTVVAGDNPAWRYLRKIIAHKDDNNPDRYSFYSTEQYAKIRFDLNNFTDDIKKNILLRPFDYIWDNTKKTDEGVQYLPVLMTEKHSMFYHRKDPYQDRSVVLGEKTTGLAGPNLMKFTNDLYVTPNVYDNFITILDKSFPSPLNDNYKQNYKFYLEDSIYSEGNVTYHIRFLPKHQRELGFVGEMYVDSASYAVKEIHLRFDVMSNVNFVRSYYISQFYQQVEGKHWMLAESQVLGDFTVLENSSDLTGFFGRKKALFSNYTIGQPIDERLFKGLEPEVYEDSALVRNEAYWETFRADSLSPEERVLFSVTERIQNDPAFRLRKNLILTFVTGYIPLKGIQIGNAYNFYSYNPIEHSRLKFGVRNAPESPIEFSAFGAYGTFDKRWKYGTSASWNMSKKGISRIGGAYRADIEQISRSFNLIDMDHIFSSLVQIGATNSRNYVTDFKAFFEQSLMLGTVLRAEYFHKEFSPVAGNAYIQIQNGVPIERERYRMNGVAATFKFSYLYQKIRGDFYDEFDYYKEYRKFPDLAIRYEFTDKALFGSDFDMQKVKMSLRQKVNAKKLGYFTYTLEVGKTFGTVPYVALDIPFGNQLIVADETSFNLMRFMEFASDQYAAVHFTHHFNGLILDRIPLINKLKWRSLVFGKAFFSSISDANNQQNYLFPTGLIGGKQPYYEVGFGLENIFKFGRIDFAWRLTPGVGEYYYFIVKPSFRFSF